MRRTLRTILKVVVAFVASFIAFAITFILGDRHYSQVALAKYPKGDGQLGLEVFVETLNVASARSAWSHLLCYLSCYGGTDGHCTL